MKKLFLSSLLSSGICFLNISHAIDGKVVFRGEVKGTPAHTCVVFGTGAPPIARVQLKNAKVANLNASGDDPASNTSFSLRLRQCDPNTKVSIGFSGGNANGRLDNEITDSTGAKDVEIAIYNGSAKVDLGLPPENQGISTVDNPATVQAFNFTAKYISPNKTATPGEVKATANIKIIYP